MRPTSREEFEIAIICALPREANPVRALFDETYDDNEENFGKAAGDVNTYSNGRIGQHDVVLCFMPGMGKGSAAGVASNLRISYPNIQLALVVGICGAVPFPNPSTEIVLGDVVISDSIIEYDFGRQYPDRFIRKRDAKTSLGRPNREIRSILSSLETDSIRQDFHDRIFRDVQSLAAESPLWKYPGREHDILRSEMPGALDADAEDDCLAPSALGSQKTNNQIRGAVVPRSRIREGDAKPIAHIGTIASADTVMKSGRHRDQIAESDGVIGFEMEGAGVWDHLPCLIIKGVCDYADSHKNKSWQDYAAATGACAAKAFLNHWRPNIKRGTSHRATWSKKCSDVPSNNIVVPEIDKNCLKDLLLTDPRNDKLRIEQSKGGLVQDSFSWILEQPVFHKWQQERDADLLWLRGDAGKGKTMLMIGLIGALCREKSSSSQNEKGSPLVSYFLCQASDSRSNSATAVLRGLLYLVMIQQPFLLRHLRSRYESTGRQLFEGPDAAYSLSEVLLGVLQSPDLPKIYFIVDAVDECEENMSQLLNFIKLSITANTNVKWIISSRNRDDIERNIGSFERLVSIKLESVPDEISEAIKHFIDIRISQMASLANNQPLQAQLKDRIFHKADGTFLWAALVIAELGKDVFVSEMLQVIEESPLGLVPLFNKMVEGIKQLHPRNTDRCLRVLAVVALAYRPLHLYQLGVVAGLSDVMVSMAECDRLINMCGSFLSIRDEHVFFIHQSAKDYLVSNQCDTVFDSDQSKTHYDIYSRSLEAMSIRLHRDMLELNEPGPIDDNSRDRRAQTLLIPLEYSCVHWLDHLVQSIGGGSQNRKELSDDGRLHQFLMKHLLHLFELLGIFRETSQKMSSIKKLLGPLKHVYSPSLTGLVKDFFRWILMSGLAIEEAPLQVYCGALVFCPEDTDIKRLFWSQRLPLVRSVTGVGKNWPNYLHVLEGHGTSAVTALASSPDDTRLATASEDCTIKVWDSMTGRMIQSLESHQKAVISISYLHDNNSLASAGLDGRVLLWDIETATQEEIYKGDKDIPTAISFLRSSGSLIVGLSSGVVLLSEVIRSPWIEIFQVSAEQDLPIVARMRGLQRTQWRMNRLMEEYELGHFRTRLRMIDKFLLDEHSPLSINVIRTSPDGQVTACIWEDGTIRLFSRPENTWEEIIHGKNRPSTLAFSPDGCQLAVGFFGGSVHIWHLGRNCWESIENGRQIEDPVADISFSKDGRFLLWACQNCLSQICIGFMGKTTHKSFEEHITAILLPLHHSQIILADRKGKASIWEIGVGSEDLSSDFGMPRGAGVMINSGFFSAAYSAAMCVVMLDLDEGYEPQEQLPLVVKYLLLIYINVCLLSFGFLLFHILGEGPLSFILDKEWLRSTYDKNGYKKGHWFPVDCIALSSDNRLVATSCSQSMHLYDSKKREWEICLGSHDELNTHSAKKLVWSTKNERIASVSQLGAAQLFDVNTGACLKTLKEGYRLKRDHLDCVEDIMFSENGQRIALSLAGGTIELWDGITLTRDFNLSDHQTRIVAASFAPNSEFLVSASLDRDVRLWDVVTGTSKSSFSLDGEVRDIIWSQDSRAFAVLLDSEQIHIFGIGLLSWECTIYTHAENAQLVKFSPDCQKIAVGRGSSLSCWDIASQSLLYTINLPYDLRHISFSSEGKFITTNMGIVELSTRALKLPQPRALGDKMHLSGNWLYCDKKKVVWLPPDYRPKSWDFCDSSIVMGQHSGRIVFLDFDL